VYCRANAVYASKIKTVYQVSEPYQRLGTIPEVGPITAIAVAVGDA
jgi:hypothetical protein